MNRTLNVALLPMNMAWADRDENLYVARSMADALPRGVDVIVFPELFSTGFLSDAAQMSALADSADHSPTLNAMRAMAAEHNAAVCGTLLWRDDNGGYRNRCVFVEPAGDTTVYDKNHLFGLGPESKLYTAGTARIPTVRFRGWEIALAVCYDLRFPVWLRQTQRLYDLLIIPANWPESRRYHWEHLLIARAIENQCYVAGANRTGEDDYGHYGQMEMLVNPMGQPMEAVNGIYSLSTDELQRTRRAFPFLADRNNFSVD